MTIRILTDSTCDIPAELIDRFNITVVPAYVNIGDKSLRDEIDLSRESFYKNLPNYDPYPTTAAASPGEFAEKYAHLVDQGAADIISIHVAANLSGIQNASRSGAELAGVQALHIDSGQLTMGLGLQVLAAAEMAQQGRSAAEIKMAIAALQNRVVVFTLIGSLNSLRRSGRVNWVQMRVGNLLQLKLILRLHQGVIEPIGRVRTRQKAMKTLVELIQNLKQLEKIAFLNTNATDLDQVKEAILPQLAPSTIRYESVACPAIGVHVGPGAVAIACITADG